MSRVTRPVLDTSRDDGGPTAGEYAVRLALILMVVQTALTWLGSNASVTFTYIGDQVKTTSS